MEAKDTQLQERDAEINRQQRELQTLRVRNWKLYSVWRYNGSTHSLVVRRREKGCRQREKGCRQRWKLRILNSRREMLKSTGNRENYSH